MGASESTLSSSLRRDDEITTVSERSENIDPVTERLRSLKIASPILESPPAERSLTDILVRKPSSASNSGFLVPNSNRFSSQRMLASSLSNYTGNATPLLNSGEDELTHLSLRRQSLREASRFLRRARTHFLIPLLQTPNIFDIRTKPHTFSISGTKDLQMANLTLWVLSRPDEANFLSSDC